MTDSLLTFCQIELYLFGKTRMRLNGDTMPIKRIEVLLCMALGSTGTDLLKKLNYAESCTHAANYLRGIPVLARTIINRRDLLRNSRRQGH